MTKDLLIKNARVWPAAGQPVIEKGSVLVRQGRIAKVGRFTARADVTVDADGQLLMPGLIQGHVHLCQTLFRGAGEDLPLLPWLRHVVWPLEAAHDPDSIRTSALLACAEMIRGGTTAFLSMETVRHTHHAFRAVHQAGLMGVIGHCLMDRTGGFPPLAVDLEDALDEMDELVDTWSGHDRLRVAVAPRFALSCSGDTLRKAAEYARAKGLLLHSHASEQVAEVNLVQERTGMPNIRYLDSVGLSGPDVCLAHCVHTQEVERDLLRDTGTNVLHCPSANLKLGSGIAPIPEYLDRGITVSLGADGAPCNNRLDAFLEMREAALMQKVRVGAEALPAREVVRLATEGGAKALGWEKEMGTLEVGKRANLILVSQDNVHTLPSADPATNVVYANSAADVLMTIVNGEILYEDGALTTLDEERLKEEARRQWKRLAARAGLG